MKSVLISTQPYWVFLIIAKAMGWNINKEKTVEVRKNYPKADNWNKTVKIYCSKDKNSFARIPKRFQPLMKQFLGKVIGEFVCDKIYDIGYSPYNHGGFISDTDNLHEKSCLDLEQMFNYLSQGYGYGWHISNLVIYDKPKDLSKFHLPCIPECDGLCEYGCLRPLKCPPQSWRYVEALE